MNRTKAKFNLVKYDGHADAEMVTAIAGMMLDKLEQKRDEGRGGWWRKDECSNRELRMMLEDHVDKAIDPHRKNGKTEQQDLIDVINIAAMMVVRLELYGSEA